MECINSRAFTLVELLVAISVAGLLLLLAVPSFFDLIRSNKLATQGTYFVTAINCARTEAIKRKTLVIICIRTGNACETSNLGWEQGWLVFSDVNGNGKVEQSELIRAFAPLGGGYTLRPNFNVNRLLYYANGEVRKANGAWPMMTFRLCAPDAVDGNLSERSREFRVSATGRVRLQFGREIAGAC